MNDIKDKIFKILFEDEGSDNTSNFVEETNAETKKERPSKPIDRESFQIPKASDILYGKQSRSSNFIDYFPKEDESKKQVEEQYEMRENVSPIFGLINQKTKKKKAVSGREIDKAVNNSNREGDYTGIVLSPIYGYDDSKANDARKVLATKDIKDQIHEEVSEEFEVDYDDDLPFEMVGQEKEENYIDDYPIEEDLEEEIEEDIVEEKNESLNDDILSYQSSETTQEITKEDIEEAFKKIQDRNDAKSTYDTTPIRLFETNDKNDDREEVDDLFSDLTGDRD